MKVAQSLEQLDFRNSMQEFLSGKIQVNPKYLRQEKSKVKID
jgi:hypothetical protein